MNSQPNIKEEQDELKVIFDIPDSIRARQQDEVISLCFSASFDAENRGSERFFLPCIGDESRPHKLN